MKYKRFIAPITLSISIFNIHSAASETSSSPIVELFQKIIQKRSFNDFVEAQHNLEKLEYDEISALSNHCTTYSEALDIIREIRENQDVAHEFYIMQQTYKEGMPYLHISQSLFPKAGRQRAIEILCKAHKTALGDALATMSREFKSISLKILLKKVATEKQYLHSIYAQLQEELNKRT